MAIEIMDLPFKIVIFHSYVSLPEGKSPFSNGFPMVFPLEPPFSYGKPHLPGKLYPIQFHYSMDPMITMESLKVASRKESLSSRREELRGFVPHHFRRHFRRHFPLTKHLFGSGDMDVVI
jgi:hypothetical protein